MTNWEYGKDGLKQEQEPEAIRVPGFGYISKEPKAAPVKGNDGLTWPQTWDASVWAGEWLKTIKEHPDVPTDEGTMIGWFANAIMCGYDKAHQKIAEKSKEPKADPGLFPCPIIGGKGNELWLVQRPAGAIALYKAVGRTDFAYIETEIGDKFISLQAFDDPPVKCWFRK